MDRRVRGFPPEAEFPGPSFRDRSELSFFNLLVVVLASAQVSRRQGFGASPSCNEAGRFSFAQPDFQCDYFVPEAGSP